VWKIAWPTVLQNAIGGLQGIIDHAMVGHYVGYTGNAAIGVSWQIFLVVIVFIASLFTGMGVLVARFAGANDHEKVNRTVYQAFLTSLVLGLGILAPIGWILAVAAESGQRGAGRSGGGAAVPAHHVRGRDRPAAVLHAGRRLPGGR
jgi:Na+-driven multidrug efflux pump